MFYGNAVFAAKHWKRSAITAVRLLPYIPSRIRSINGAENNVFSGQILCDGKEIPVYQPVTFRDEKEIQRLRDLRPDIIIVIAYGKILPQAVLDIPAYGAVNIHASLLPKYRGAAPVQRAIIDQEKRPA